MKKRIFIITLLIIVIVLNVSCRGEYKGKDVASIEFTQIDYMGGFEDIKKLDFNTNQYLTAHTNPENFEQIDFEEFIKLDNIKNKEFIDSAYKYGLFNLKDKYQPTFPVLDGGGWELVITFDDGTTKVSKGSNAGPTRIFEKVDKAFFDIFKEEFFGYVDSEYMYPPYVDIAIRSGNGSYGFGLTKTNYKWHQKAVNNINNIEVALSEEKFTFKEGIEYTLSLYDANWTYKAKSISVVSYDLSGEDPKNIEINDNKISLEVNRVYVFKMEFKYGTCEYVLSTYIDTLEKLPSDFKFGISYKEGNTQVVYKSDEKRFVINNEVYEFELSDKDLLDIYRLIRLSNFEEARFYYGNTEEYDPNQDYYSLYGYYKKSGMTIMFRDCKFSEEFIGEGKSYSDLTRYIFNKYLLDEYKKIIK